jgi:CHAD domain-containing protein
MRPSTVTKARRGYRLLRGEALAPMHAHAAAFDRKATSAQAARRALALALDQLQANEEGLLASEDPEFLHQMRSALRRIRSALRVFRKVLGPDLENGLRDDLRGLADVMGAARDWDVLATGTLPPLLQARGDAPGNEALVAEVEKRRAAAHRGLREALASPRHTTVVLALARWLAQTRESAGAGGDLRKLAARVLRRQHRKLIGGIDSLSHEDPGQRHRLRIAAKRFRYAVDALESLYPARRVKAIVRPLGKVPAALGDANDAVVAWRLLAALDPPPALAQFARGWLEARVAASIEDFERHAGRLRSAAPFWRQA